jgi:glycosyltransferase involved in cell wall biosynthesis
MAEVSKLQRRNLLVFADDWGRHPSSCQHLIQNLLDQYEVYWVNTIGTRRPGLDLKTLRRALGKFRAWMRPTTSDRVLPAHLHLLNPPMWPWFRSRFDRFLNRRLLLRVLLPLVRSLPGPCLAVTTIPLVADLIGVLPVQRWIYYCVDDFGQWPGLDQVALQRMETRLLQRIDEVIVVSEILREKLERRGRTAALITHGVDVAYWTANGARRIIPALEGLPRPLIVFWGITDRRMEASFVTRLASDLEWGTIVLAGPQGDYDPLLRKTARVVCLGPLGYELLPHLAREAAVLIMPYADIPVTRAMQPLKLKEYLATGKPVVVRDLPATREWRDCLDLAATPQNFSDAVRVRLATGLPDEQRRARARLATENWAAKARLFERSAWGGEVSQPPWEDFELSVVRSP